MRAGTVAFAGLVALAGLTVLSCSKGGGSSPTYSLTYAAPGGSGFADGQIAKVGFAANVARNFTFANGIAVSGQVTDGLGAPMNNVNVSFGSSAALPDLDNDNTDVGGNYAVTLPDGTWVAVVDSGVGAIGSMTVSSQSVVSPGPVVFNYQFPAIVAVTGSVFELGGPAIANAQLTFTGAQSGADVTINADGIGMYVTALVPDTYEVVVEPAGASALTHLKQKFPSIVINGAMVRNFSLTQGVTVSGIVRDNLGAPLLEDTDIEVILAASSNFFAPTDVTSSDVDGTYSIGPVPLGSIIFDLEAPGDSSFPKQRITRSVSTPPAQTEDFMLARGFLLTGTILQAGGVTPEPNVEVVPVPTSSALPPDDDDSDGAGMFEISLFAGTYNVQLDPDPTNMQVPEVQTIVVSGNTVLNVTLTAGVLINGTVFEPDGTTPAPDVRVDVDGTSATDTTDGAGNYSILAPVGTHMLMLTDESGALEDFVLRPETGVVVASPGPVVHLITLTLATTGGTVVQGFVYEPDGTTPVQNAIVTARHNTTGNIIGKATTDALGAYSLVIE